MSGKYKNIEEFPWALAYFESGEYEKPSVLLFREHEEALGFAKSVEGPVYIYYGYAVGV